VERVQHQHQHQQRSLFLKPVGCHWMSLIVAVVGFKTAIARSRHGRAGGRLAQARLITVATFVRITVSDVATEQVRGGR
jgi:hypothetical protein